MQSALQRQEEFLSQFSAQPRSPFFSENKALMSYKTLQIKTHPINNSSVAKGILVTFFFFSIIKVFRHSPNK